MERRLKGTNSAVLYNEKLYRELCNLDEDDTTETWMRLHFQFAVALVHEVAHAAVRADVGAEVGESPFEYRTM